MCSLLQNRIKGALRKHCFIFIAMALCNGVYVTDAYANEQNLHVAQSMFNFLSWEKFWYGQFFGEDCYNKLVGGKKRIAIQQKTESEIKHVFHCNEKRGQVAEQKTIDAYIANTNFLFHGVWLGDKPAVQISMGSAPPGCNIDDLEPRVTNLLKDSRTAFIDVNLPSVELFQLPSAAEDLKEQVVLEAVKRSMEFFINYYYFEPAPFGEPQRKVSAELLEKIKRSSRILLARFRNTDPFLLVYYEGDDKIYQLDFPSSEILSKKDVCVQVFSAVPYLGEVPDSVREKVMRHLLNKIKDNSIELQLQVKALGAK